MKTGLTAIAALCMAAASTAFADPVLRGATLPDARTVARDATATAFFTVLNSGDTDATGCTVQASNTSGTDLSEYVITSQLTENGVAIGAQNPTFPIAAGSRADLVVGISRNDAFNFNTSAEVGFRVECDGGFFSPVWPEVNQVYAQFRDNAPDIIMIADTVTRDGVANINGNRRALVAVAAVNIGSGDTAGSNDATIGLAARAGNPNTSPIINASACELGNDGTCIADYQSCVTNGRDACLTTQIGSDAATFAYLFDAPPETGMPFAPNLLHYGPVFSWTEGASESATRAAIGGFDPDITLVPLDSLWGQFIGDLRNDADAEGQTLERASISFSPDGTGYGTLVRPVDRGAFTELVDQPILFEWGPPCGDPCVAPEEGFDITRMTFLDTRQGDDSRANDYYVVTDDRISCSLQPVTGGRCTISDTPGEQIAGQPEFFDAGDAFSVTVSPSAQSQRSERLGSLVDQITYLEARGIFSDGFEPSELTAIVADSAGETINLLIADGCEIEIFVSPEQIAPGLEVLFVDAAMVVTLRILDTEACRNHPFFGPLSETGVQQGSYKTVIVASTIEEAFFTAPELSVRFSLSVDPTDPDADTRIFDLRLQQPAGG